MDEIEIRTKAVELSVLMCSSIASAVVIHHGAEGLTELTPFAIVKEIEEYIKSGIIPKPMEVKLRRM